MSTESAIKSWETRRKKYPPKICEVCGKPQHLQFGLCKSCYEKYVRWVYRKYRSEELLKEYKEEYKENE